MSSGQPTDPELLRKWVEAWRIAAPELERLNRIEIETVDTREAIRQIFGTGRLPNLPPPEPTSGLIEQQARFRRIYERLKSK